MELDVSPNKVLKIVDSRISPTSDFGKLMELLKNHEQQMTKIARDKSEKQLLQAFPADAFESITVVNLKGWPFHEDDYIEWAKDITLSLDDFKEAIRWQRFDLSCPPELLTKEREHRQLLVNQFQSLHLMDLYSSKVDNLSEDTKRKHKLSSTEGKAIAQIMLPNTKFLIAQWMQSKMEVRKAILSRNSWLGDVTWILKSSLWNSSIFPKSAINDLRYETKNDVAEKLGLVGPPVNRFSSQQTFKKTKPFQKQNISGTFQAQQQNNSFQNFPQQKFREGRKPKKGYQYKKKRWVKTKKSFNKNFNDSKNKNNASKNKFKNAKGNAYKNSKQEQ